MSLISNLQTDKELAAVIKNTPQIFEEILLKLSSNSILPEKELLLLKKDLLFTVLVVIMIENGFQPIKSDGDIFDPGLLNIQRLSEWKVSTGFYEAEFIMLGYSEISTKLIMIPLATTALVNAVINEIALEAYSVCLSVDKHFVFTKHEAEVSQMFQNLQHLSDAFKNQVVSPIKSKILSMCGYPGPSLIDLPEDMFWKILLYLPISDIINVALTCKKCYQYLADDNLWHKIFLRDFRIIKPAPKPTPFRHSSWRLSYKSIMLTEPDDLQKDNWRLSYISRYKFNLLRKEETRKRIIDFKRREGTILLRLGIPRIS